MSITLISRIMLIAFTGIAQQTNGALSSASSTNGPVAIALAPASKECKRNAPCLIALTLTNTSDATLVIQRQNGALSFLTDYKVIFSRRDAVAGVSRNVSLSNGLPTRPMHESFRFKKLLPTESFAESIDLSKAYDMSVPGTYTLLVIKSVSTRVGQTVDVSSGSLSFDIVR